MKISLIFSILLLSIAAFATQPVILKGEASQQGLVWFFNAEDGTKYSISAATGYYSQMDETGDLIVHEQGRVVVIEGVAYFFGKHDVVLERGRITIVQ